MNTKKIVDWLLAQKWKFLALVFLLAIGYSSIVFFGNDNNIEQAIEFALQLWPGVNIDLSPE